jgi:hypothetical protein
VYACRMKWPRFLGRRPAESKDADEARGSQELEEQYAAEAAKPPPQEATTSEPREPSHPEPTEPPAEPSPPAAPTAEAPEQGSSQQQG